MRRAARFATILLCAAAAASPCVLAEPAGIGRPAPPISATVITPGVEAFDLSWESLRGKHVVLEFWASWCLPCAPALAKLGAQAETFKDRPVRFIAVTSDDREKAARFLAKRPVPGSLWVAIDGQATFDAYGVGGIPHVVVVDPHGTIVAVTRPKEVTDEVVESLLAGKRVELARVEVVTEPVWSEEPPKEPVIRPAETRKQVFKTTFLPPKGMRVQMNAALVSNLLREAYDVSYVRSIEEGEPSEGLYYVDLLVPDLGKEDWRLALRRALAERLGATARLERREADTLVLRPIPGKTVALRPAPESPDSHVKATSIGIEATNAPIQDLVETLESSLAMPVVDETGLTGQYDFELVWDYGDRASIEGELAKLGLELAPARREIEMLIIEGKGGR